MNLLKPKIPISVSNKEIWTITYPIIFGNLAQTIMVLVNTVFLGHVGNIELGAVMLAGIYYLVFTALAQGFAIGVQIIIARHLGEHEFKKIGKVFEHGLFFMLILGVLLWAILHFLSDGLLRLIIDSPDIYSEACKFMNYRHYGIVFVCMNYLFRSLYIGLSNTKIITFSTFLMAAINIFFDYALIFGNLGFPNMGIAGAGISSVFAEISAMLVFIGYTIAKLPLKKYAIFAFQKIEKSILKHILKLALPTMAQRLMSFGLWFVFFTMIEHTGELPIAISGIVRSVYMLTTIPVFAYSATSNTLTSRLLGANKANEIPATLKQILKMSLVTIIPMIILCASIPQQIAQIYTDDIFLATSSIPTIYVVLIATIIMSGAMIYFEFISGTGHTLAALLLEACVLIFYVLYVWLSSDVLNLNIEWIWCTEILYATFLLLISLAFLKFANWKNSEIK